MSVFAHAQGIKTVHAREGGQKWQNSVHVIVKSPLMSKKNEKIGKKIKHEKIDCKTFPFGIFQGICFLRSINFARQRLQIQGFL